MTDTKKNESTKVEFIVSDEMVKSEIISLYNKAKKHFKTGKLGFIEKVKNERAKMVLFREVGTSGNMPNVKNSIKRFGFWFTPENIDDINVGLIQNFDAISGLALSSQINIFHHESGVNINVVHGIIDNDVQAKLEAKGVEIITHWFGSEYLVQPNELELKQLFKAATTDELINDLSQGLSQLNVELVAKKDVNSLL